MLAAPYATDIRILNTVQVLTKVRQQSLKGFGKVGKWRLSRMAKSKCNDITLKKIED